MIYAAYAGTGKSYFCQENPEAIDLICMSFKYTNLSEVSGNMESDREVEQIKANPKLTLRNYWVLLLGDKIFALLLPRNTSCNTDYRFDIGFSGSRSNTIHAYISG